MEYNQPINNTELRQVLKDYFLTENPEKPLVIFSKPFSGRTNTIRSVAEECGVNFGMVWNGHLPLADSKTIKSSNGTTISFDQWLDSYPVWGGLLCDAIKEKQYAVIEVTPNEFMTIDDGELWGNGITSDSRLKGFGRGYLQALKSDKYQLIAYYPEVEEWIEWAQNNDYPNVVVEFAIRYPEFYYLLGYDVYDGIRNFFLEAEEAKEYGEEITVKDFIVHGLPNVMVMSLARKVLASFLSEKGIPFTELFDHV